MSFVYSILRPVGAFIIAWLVFVVVGVSVSTQYILAELTALGADVPFGLRLQVTGEDIIGMQPLYGMIFGVGLLIAVVAAWGIIKLGAPKPHIVFAAAGFISVIVTLLAMGILLGIGIGKAFAITPIASTRSIDGFLMQCLVGGLAGYVYIRAREKLGDLLPPPQQTSF